MLWIMLRIRPMKSGVRWSLPFRRRATRPIASNASITKPENRLVAAEPEKRWNHALTHVNEMECRLEEATALAPLTIEQCQRLRALGDDLEQLWDDPRSPANLKKRILRTVLEEVIGDTTDDLLPCISNCTGLGVPIPSSPCSRTRRATTTRSTHK